MAGSKKGARRIPERPHQGKSTMARQTARVGAAMLFSPLDSKYSDEDCSLPRRQRMVFSVEPVIEGFSFSSTTTSRLFCGTRDRGKFGSAGRSPVSRPVTSAVTTTALDDEPPLPVEPVVNDSSSYNDSSARRQGGRRDRAWQ